MDNAFSACLNLNKRDVRRKDTYEPRANVGSF